MKVLNVNSILDPVTGGGTAERTLQLSRFMCRAGIDCKTLTTDIGLTSQILATMSEIDINVLPCINRRFRIPRCTRRMIRSIVETVDVVHLMDHWTLLNVLVYREARSLGKPYVVCPAGALPIYGRSGTLKALYNRLVGYDLIRNANGHVAITALESFQFEPYGVGHERVHVIPNGVDCEDMIEPNDAEFREKNGLGDNPYILFLGRINSIKGPDLLLRAFLDAEERFRNYHIVFAGPDGGMLNELKDIVSQFHSKDRVHFIGYVGGREKKWAYSAADVVVIPSRQEAMSIVALEAGAAGTPVIMTDRCGFDELADSGGGLVVAATVEALRDGMVRMIDNSGCLSGMGEKLRCYVRSQFGWDKIVERYMEFYLNVVKGTAN